MHTRTLIVAKIIRGCRRSYHWAIIIGRCSVTAADHM